MPIILTSENISKRFLCSRNRTTTIRESLTRVLTRQANPQPVTWALQDVSFTVEQGRVLGIIGHNGAGKSTMLRLLCGVGRPTSGRIVREGRVSGILELGGGFNPELTGRQNLVTAGLLSGMRHETVRDQEESIIDFAELEHVIDQPVRTYSTGMYLRLAFAAAIALEPAVLVLDEVLAVGDERFQRKCLDRIDSLKSSGSTLIITSHNADQIQALCDEVLVLEEGRVVMQGDAKTAVSCYHDLMRQRSEVLAVKGGKLGAAATRLTLSQGKRLGTEEVKITKLVVYDDHGLKTETVASGTAITVEVGFSITETVKDMAFTLGIFSDTHVKCSEVTIASIHDLFGQTSDSGTIQCEFGPLPLLPGTYFLNVGFYPTDWSHAFDYHWQMHPLHLTGDAVAYRGTTGIVALSPHCSMKT
ncbi:MAG: ABC transporter ATP-binding protein [Nitrospirales bacterium]